MSKRKTTPRDKSTSDTKSTSIPDTTTVTEKPKATRSLKPKPYKVLDPDGKTHLVYALTELGAIARMKALRVKETEKWSVEPASGEDLYRAAIDRVEIIDAPESIAPKAQLDAFGPNDGASTTAVDEQ